MGLGLVNNVTTEMSITNSMPINTLLHHNILPQPEDI